MKRLLTVTGVAAMFAVGLAAQQTTTGTSGTTAQGTQTATTAGGQRGGPRTITGCLRAGDTAGTYMLTNIEGMGGGGTTAGATTTGGGTTTGSTAAGATTTGQAGGRGMNSLMLTADSSVDLKAHVGHKIEVTGTMAGGRRNGDTTSGGTTAAGGTTTGGGTTAAGGTSTAGTAGTQGGGRGGMRSMTVTTVKMVSDSCS
jgi:hypothetical protein